MASRQPARNENSPFSPFNGDVLLSFYSSSSSSAPPPPPLSAETDQYNTRTELEYADARASFKALRLIFSPSISISFARNKSAKIQLWQIQT